MKNIVFINKQFLPADQAKVSIFDRGFMFGDGLFETFRSYQGRVFALDLHLKRLSKGAQTLGINFRPDAQTLSKHIHKLLRLNNLSRVDANIKLLVTRGIEPFGSLRPSASLKPTTVIIAKPLDKKIHELQHKGIRAVFVDAERTMPMMKSLNLLPNIMGLRHAFRKGYFEGILKKGDKILEGTVTNIFISQGRGLITPPLKDDILPGITRGLVIRLAKKEGIPVQEASLTKEDLKQGTEAFLTNSLMEIVPLVKVENQLIGKGTVGKLTRKLQQCYDNLVTNQISLDFALRE